MPTRDAKEMIRQIVDFLEVGDRAAVDLWSVLTALRGPDNHDDELKFRTTARIRGMIGLTPFKHGFLCSRAVPEPLPEPIPTHDAVVWRPSSHFTCHYNHAVEVLKRLGYFQRLKKEENNA